MILHLESRSLGGSGGMLKLTSSDIVLNGVA